MSEAELESAIMELCGRWGLKVYHEPDSRRQTFKGWPDLVIIGPHGILWRELKSANGTLTDEQRTVGHLLNRAGGNWAVWRPKDLRDRTIFRQLFAIV